MVVAEINLYHNVSLCSCLTIRQLSYWLSSLNFDSWSAVKSSVPYSEQIILAGKLFFCSIVKQLGQLALKAELFSQAAATVCNEEAGTVDENAEDVASHCNESDSFSILLSICSGMSFFG
jgi:hypothetical protein